MKDKVCEFFLDDDGKWKQLDREKQTINILFSTEEEKKNFEFYMNSGDLAHDFKVFQIRQRAYKNLKSKGEE